MRRNFITISLVTVFLLSLTVFGCGKSDADKAVSDTVKTVTGGEMVEKGRQMQEDVEKKVNESMKKEVKNLMKRDENQGQGNPAGDEGTKNE